MIPVIPMMGLGERFSKSGYSEYKPFVRINSKHLIKKVIDPVLKKFSAVYVICNRDIESQLRVLYNQDTVKIIVLNNPTKGAAETIYQACDSLPKNEKIACLDCDTILHDSAINKISTDFDNAILTFIDEDKIGIYSYVNVDSNDNIIEIKEKEPISNIANAGVYIFKNSLLLKESCQNVLSKSGELYLSRAVADAINTGNVFKSIDISNQFDCCGTPAQLKTYSRSILDTDKKIICFDIDGTLVYDLYKNPNPIEKNVKFCNEAYRNGHEIVLHTARGMLSNKEDGDKIEALRPYIVEVLEKIGLLYHRLILMKPYADLYIDDKSIPAHKDLEKETGLYLYEEHSSRYHNKIISNGNTIIKEGSLEGENYYYSNVPEEIKDLFPTIYSSSKNRIELQKINKPTYSTLLMSQKLTKLDIDNLVNSINRIHESKCDNKDIDLSWAYKQKVLERLDHYKDLYKKLKINVDVCKRLTGVDFTYSYGRIHGDPVFTNVFIDSPYCKFIDCRGAWDNEMTNSGDLDYDYAKILQSLYGYDYALHNEPIQDHYLTSMRLYYLDQIKHLVNLDQLKIKTKLIFISMIPFHKEDIQRCERFEKIISTI
jgi:dTDP-glucose pyrophosphorylase